MTSVDTVRDGHLDLQRRILASERQLFLSSIAIRNASDNIQVFNEMFVSCYVHSCVTTEISGPGVCNFKF